MKAQHLKDGVRPGRGKRCRRNADDRQLGDASHCQGATAAGLLSQEPKKCPNIVETLRLRVRKGWLPFSTCTQHSLVRTSSPDGAPGSPRLSRGTGGTRYPRRPDRGRPATTDHRRGRPPRPVRSARPAIRRMGAGRDTGDGGRAGHDRDGSTTAAGYFSRVPKARVLEAVTEARGAEVAGRIAGSQKRRYGGGCRAVAGGEGGRSPNRRNPAAGTAAVRRWRGWTPAFPRRSL